MAWLESLVSENLDNIKVFWELLYLAEEAIDQLKDIFLLIELLLEAWKKTQTIFYDGLSLFGVDFDEKTSVVFLPFLVESQFSIIMCLWFTLIHSLM